MNMKKSKLLLHVFMLIVLTLALIACSQVNDDLSGKTINVAYVLPFEDTVDDPDKYDSLMKVTFNDNNEVEHIVYDEIEGSYTLKDNELIVTFENDNEQLDITFNDLTESEKSFSLYSASISDIAYDKKDSSKIDKLSPIRDRLQKGLPIELIEIK